MSWKKAGETPYVSVLFANRNDNYGEDLTDRINKFIQYYYNFRKELENEDY